MHYPLLAPFPVAVETIPEMPNGSYIELNQLHGQEIHFIDRSSPTMQEGDGMITREEGLTLVIKHADCQVAIAYDPLHHALGMVHAGWRGQCAGIYSKLIEAMREAFGTKPQDLYIALAPSLGPTKSQFIHYKTELSPWMWAYEEEPLHFNLWKIAERQFLSLGILPEHLSLPPCCTYSDERWHSYRRNKTHLRNATAGTLISSR